MIAVPGVADLEGDPELQRLRSLEFLQPQLSANRFSLLEISFATPREWRSCPSVVAGSDFRFEERGPHELKGVPGSWTLYEVMKKGAARYSRRRF